MINKEFFLLFVTNVKTVSVYLYLSVTYELYWSKFSKEV